MPSERREDYIKLGKMQAHLETLVEEVPKIRDDVTSLRESVSALKVKAGVWGLIGGLLMVIPIYLKWVLGKGGH